MLVDWAQKVQNEGIMALDTASQDTKDPFLKYLFSLVETGYKPDEIREFAQTYIEEHYFRHLNESNILQNMAAAAPCFWNGRNLDWVDRYVGRIRRPLKMGPGLSMALMTTLYGVLFARFIFQPASTKVKQLLGIQRFREYLLLEGLTLILDKKSPLFIEDKLNAFLDRKNNSKEAKVAAKASL